MVQDTRLAITVRALITAEAIVFTLAALLHAGVPIPLGFTEPSPYASKQAPRPHQERSEPELVTDGQANHERRHDQVTKTSILET
jgi:hypothetical protein